ncbi:hypothetical protein [Methanospirillum hungatei]|jgi:hypothetical protein|uniref:hypothetical protein n=1 Tax=Methanospirillum hungatei TaxID=2203 RepID=UPI0009D55795|nr:hypothetical protein [Methanospirillum hungatei]OQA60459.1 MAG: hypothetical protein BWY45_00162 [Euryarchaeota archaeon ADurb.Bin294]HOW03881.1 hypothetical protein [Methanospirillum hungatei]
MKMYQGGGINIPGEQARVFEAIASGKPTAIDWHINPVDKPPVQSFAQGACDYAVRTLN